MIIRQSAGIKDTASIREPARCRPEFCDEPVGQTSRDPKLVVRCNHKFFNHFRLIVRSVKGRITASRASASAQSSSGCRLPIGKQCPQSQKQSLAHKSSAIVYDLSATVYCI